MTSSVYVKFMSQKEPRRIEFDGTGISVFELKRDIIIKNGLDRSGTDFDLALYNEDGSEEYDDDTTVIPRSTTVVARRLPAMKPGAGRAARYVSGKMPVNARNSSRREQATKAAAKAKSQSDAIAKMASAMTEEEKMMAMFAAQGEQWNAAQEEMSHQAPVYKPGSKKPANVPDHEPPNGYVCHRCGEKGHWIQQCPTNDNPEYDNRPRVKRTTGIPKSFLKTVDKATVLAQGADGDESKTPAGIMVNADGEFVIAEPDKASWQKFQAKAQGSAEAKKIAAQDEKELQERGLECDIDNKMFIDPMKTPCCAKTYCNDCITNALIEGDLVCPSCHTEGVLIDDLKPDEEATASIEAYLKEREEAKRERSKSPEDIQVPPTEEAQNTKDSKDSQDSKDPKDLADDNDTTAKTEKSKSPTPAPAVNSPTDNASQKSTPIKEASPVTNGPNNNFNGPMNGGGPMNGVGGFNRGGPIGAPTGPRQPNFPQPNNEEDAYFRKPVNPHRHQNRQRRVRPSDYREL
ncbi:hypothetical protein VPNG_06583 [Cytospora leucostoma]|uniref:DWNN domain-containing protein n=1 Tax=Cytospora leucostoma TaxID=1230097 RepID=A0A423X2E3_9PEZI|nr:hypothetical protein VPNG_06583 [Cytospora leucostoma]